MLKVGLTGGYATGKSCVAHELERLGCHIVYADVLGHQVLLPNGEAYAPVIAEFGDGILNEGEIDRKRLAAIVFGDPVRLDKLSSFVHPAVFRLEEKLLREFAAKDPHGIAIIEAAILIETKRSERFDRIILTACDEEVQISRGMRRDKLTREQVLARLANQMSLEEKRKHSDYVIDTSGDKEETVRQVQIIHRDLMFLAREISK
ncbi:MAG TPA: dephospho-CoA kinase [Bryobacteraceae bacterium]|nr:dephospho-CoA kinase [Bryobacteraceae bacterium]